MQATTVTAVRHAFNARCEVVRVVALLSPT
jgi:hypothetical protein